MLGLAISVLLFGFWMAYWKVADMDMIVAYQALLFNDGKATLTDVFFRGNRAHLGSGLFNTSRATLQWRRAPVGRP